jgi:BirA family transcriptional regulator, biotin operon repressor / biotin---[acetyl-CoA-carboxylase] ligase
VRHADLQDFDGLAEEVLRPGGLWRELEVVAATGSTNADLAERARRGAAPGAVRVAGHQSAGRGRQGRTWTAPAGTGIALSVLIRPEVAERRWTWLPLLAGLAVAEGLRSTSAQPAELKWPNDVLVGDRKICGVLAERVQAPDGPVAVVGMGINVDLPESDLPVPTATSLAVLDPGRSHPRGPIVAAVLAAFELELRRWEAGPDDSGVAAAYRTLCRTLGRRVRVQLSGDEVVEGIATDLEDDGRLVVRSDAGPRSLGAGDVLHLR